MMIGRKKVVLAIKKGDTRGVKYTYFKTIDNYLSDELHKIFVSHMDTKANVTKNRWTG
ncbi:hypothetical protein [Tenacibaculum sp. C7A-26P2]|uniref:hypothetical protein n=1 Tax=Tenacibaculum sp. C7A-26P2 TaxID=3447504 RepID=UPI003F8752CC